MKGRQQKHNLLPILHLSQQPRTLFAHFSLENDGPLKILWFREHSRLKSFEDELQVEQTLRCGGDKDQCLTNDYDDFDISCRQSNLFHFLENCLSCVVLPWWASLLSISLYLAAPPPFPHPSLSVFS